MVKDKIRRHQVSLGLSKSMKCDTFSLQCFDTVGWATGQEGHPACTKLGVGFLVMMTGALHVV